MSVELSAVLLNKLKEQFGEAFYILDSEQFRINYNELKNAFSSIYSNFNIAYSYKTNYIPKLCKIVNEMGGYAEVVSEMELELALRLGVQPKNIIWNGPIKNEKTVEIFLTKGGIVNIDSLEEIRLLRTLTKKYPDCLFRLGIRCNYDVNDNVISRFGFDICSSDFNEALSFVTGTPNVKFSNLHCHFAKRQIKYWKARVKGMIDLIDRVNIIPERVDLGGGLFGKMPDSLKVQLGSYIPSYTDYANIVAAAFQERFGNNGPELIIEPGSALVGDCMKFVSIVKSIKCVRGKYIASISGSQKNISMNGINPPIEIYPSGNTQKYYNEIDLAGYTCIESDVIYRNYTGKLAIGDYIVIGNCGSYSLVMKPPFILPNFPVIELSEDQVEVIKRAETFDDIFNTFIY